jgi:hypothetical protein
LTISQPQLEPLPVDGQRAVWPRSWATFITEIWRQLAYQFIAPVKTVTGNYTATLTDAVILINADITVTLPTAAKAKDKRFTCKAINAGAGTRTVSGNGSNIDGAATWTTTTQYTSMDFVSDGTQYWIV